MNQEDKENQSNELNVNPDDLRTIAHGLLNDLCVIQSNAQSALSDEVDPSKVEDLEAVLKASKRAEEWVKVLRKLYA